MSDKLDSKAPSLFRRLTSLFRSGPTVRRRIKNTTASDSSSLSSGQALFRRSNSDTYNATLSSYGSFDRMSRYGDFGEMESTPEIASALDIYAEESVSPDVSGKILNIFSDNRKIQDLLETLFYDTLNIDFNLPMWVRNLCKYGDFFLFNDVSNEFGIINVYPIPISEIEREEGFDGSDPSAVRFRWITQGNKILENWEISHFRMLGNDSFLPYGSSVLESARRIWRQLILIEDAMLVYRVIRSPERRVFYIDVGNVPPEEISNYVEQAKTALKRNQIVDSTSGRIDIRYNPMPIWKDTPIPLLDSRTLTIEELSKEVDAGKECWVYSIQDETNQIVPGKVSWCGKNYTADMMIKVWLDDDTFVMTAPEHPFVMRDGTSKRADELVEGDSLMPLYRKMSSKEEGWDVIDYPVVYDPGTGKDVLLHRRVANSALSNQRDEVRKNIDLEVNNNLVVHHKNFDSLDASPSNLEWMGNVDHWKYHASIGRERLITYNKSDKKRRETTQKNIERNSVAAMSWYNGSDLHKEHNKIRRAAQFKSWAVNKEKRSATMKMVLPQECIDIAINALHEDPTLNRDHLFEVITSRDDFRNAWEVANDHNNRRFERYGSRTFAYQIKEFGYAGFSDFKKQAVANHRNHKVSRIEKVTTADDVYCMTVVGPDGEDDRHNFAVQSMDSTLTYCNNGIFVKNSVDEDYFIPVRGDSSGTRVESIAGGTNTSAIEDVEYIQKKLFAALKIPKAYLGFDEDVGSKATLAQEDIRFSRTIQRVQKTIIAELNKLAMIHLYAHGYQDEDLLDFELKLANPSSIAQQQKLELIRSKFEIAGTAPEGMVDRNWIRKNVLELTDEDIALIESGKVSDKKIDLKLEAVAIEEDGSAGSEGDSEEPADDADSGSEEDLFSSDYIDGKILDGLPIHAQDMDDEYDEDNNDEDNNDENDANDGISNLSIDDENAPIKASSAIKNVFGGELNKPKRYKADRLSMPDFTSMVSVKKGSARSQDSMLRPYDRDSVLNPFDEGPFDNWERKIEKVARMTPDMKNALKQMNQRLSVSRKSILTERERNLSIVDALLEDDDLKDFGDE